MKNLDKYFSDRLMKVRRGLKGVIRDCFLKSWRVSIFWVEVEKFWRFLIFIILLLFVVIWLWWYFILIFILCGVNLRMVIFNIFVFCSGVGMYWLILCGSRGRKRVLIFLCISWWKDGLLIWLKSIIFLISLNGKWMIVFKFLCLFNVKLI